MEEKPAPKGRKNLGASDGPEVELRAPNRMRAVPCLFWPRLCIEQSRMDGGRSPAQFFVSCSLRLRAPGELGRSDCAKATKLA